MHFVLFVDRVENVFQRSLPIGGYVVSAGYNDLLPILRRY